MIITYYRCCCCGEPFKERDRTKVFCDRCSVIERDEHERELFEKVYRVKLNDLRDWDKKKAFLRAWDDFDLNIRGNERQW